jgi:hypothetical protein
MTEEISTWQPTSSLGKYLWLAAKTLTAMEDVVEEKLISKYLLSDPPLRIRRTLDQYMYCSMSDLSTAHRYKDQVVYRATQTRLDGEPPGCSQRAQVLMVDQLWMWILDRNTIMTCFPKRWGDGRHGTSTSDIHASIRERLAKLAQSSKGWTARDLAPVIVDECSKVLFGRSKSLDERPDVIAIFRSATAEIVRNPPPQPSWKSWT